MDRTRLRVILDAYGADPAHWPESERDAALKLLGASPDLTSARAEAAALDQMIAAAPAGEVNNALLGRIFESAATSIATAKAAPRRVSPRHRLPSLGGLIRVPAFGGVALARPAAILMLAVCVGLGAGALTPVALGSSTPSDVDMLSAMWGGSVLNQDEVNW